MNVNHAGLKGEAIRDFDQHAVPLINRTVAAAGVNVAGVPWGVVVTGCGPYSGHNQRPAADTIRLGITRVSMRQIEASIKPKNGAFTYDVKLCVPRTLDPTTAANALAIVTTKKPAQPAEPDGGSPPDPKANGKLAASKPSPADLIAAGMSRLTDMRSGLDAVINIAQNARASAEMRAEVQAKHDAAKETARPLLAELDKAETLLREHTSRRSRIADELKAAKDAVVRLTTELTAAEADYAKAKDKFDLAERAAEEPAKAWDDAAAELAECERLEAERIKTINETPGIATLLAALESMNSGKVA